MFAIRIHTQLMNRFRFEKGNQIYKQSVKMLQHPCGLNFVPFVSKLYSFSKSLSLFQIGQKAEIKSSLQIIFNRPINYRYFFDLTILNVERLRYTKT